MGLEKPTLEQWTQCRNSFAYFCENVLDLEMTDYHKELARLPLEHRYLCIIIPTGHSKTTLFSIAYAVWKLWKEEGIEMCLTSSSENQSMRILRQVQETLEAKPFFKDILPTNRSEAWNKSQIETKNHNQYYIKPFNPTARGIHPHCIIYDDLLRDSEVEMNQIRETFWSVFYPRGQIHNCQHIVVGTPMAEDDLYAELEKPRNKDWFVVRKSAVQESPQGKWLKALWPQRFSLDMLSRIKSSMTELRFEREYMCVESNTLINMIEGAKPIKDVNEGELVLTHLGNFKKVIHTMHRSTNELYWIKIYGYNREVGITAEHPILTLRDGKAKFIETEKLKKGDVLLFPRMLSSGPVFEIGKDKAVIWGWYLAEGAIGAKDKSVVFYMATKQNAEIEYLIDALKSEGYSPIVYPYRDSSVTPITVNSKKLVEELTGLFGRAKSKRIPSILYSVCFSDLRTFFDSYIKGDGCVERNGICVSSVCIGVSEGISRIAQILGYVPSKQYCDKIPRYGGKIDGRMIFGCGARYRLRLLRSPTKSKLLDEYIGHPIREIRKTSGSFSVYNLEVEGDNSYCVGNFSVHNCRPRSPGDALYPKEMVLNSIDEDLEFNYETKGIAYIGCDFAMSTKASGDFNVFTVVDSFQGAHLKETDKGTLKIGNPVFIRKMIRFRGASGQIPNIKTLFEAYKTSKIIADSSHVGAKFVQELRENQLSVDAQDFRPANRNMLLMNLRRLLEQNRLVIPGGVESSPLTNRLIREMTSFQNVRTKAGTQTWRSCIDHDDCVMSLCLAVKDVASPRKMMKDLVYGV